jgi:phosphoglycerate dehydrogenase-like enzyme
MVSLLTSERLQWVHTGAAGVDHPIWAQLVDKGAVLTTGHGQALCMAEYVLAEVLARFQRIGERRAEQAARRWTRLPFREIAGTSWLIIGFGAIGQDVAARAKAFGARSSACAAAARLTPWPSNGPARGREQPAARGGCRGAVGAVEPGQTRRAGAFFAAMKPGSVLVNVGRGDLVDEPALLAALAAGAPDRAILDVFHDEPLKDDSLFWDHPKVSLTAHASAFGSGQAARNDAIFVENLRRRLAGRCSTRLTRDLGR